jgi:hypothetical protein
MVCNPIDNVVDRLSPVGSQLAGLHEVAYDLVGHFLLEAPLHIDFAEADVPAIEGAACHQGEGWSSVMCVLFGLSDKSLSTACSECT